MAGRNTTITAVDGVRVGHWTDAKALTGCTVIVCDVPMVCGVDVRGSATGTRETEVCRPTHIADCVHGLVLSGGSAFGLDTAGGVQREMERDGRGIAVGDCHIPLVPAAILFDLGVGDARTWPDGPAGAAAYRAATAEPVRQGNIGAGTGATVGKVGGLARAMKGGLGSAALSLDACTVGALVAVNALGDVRNPRTGKILAGMRRPSGRGFADSAKLVRGGMPPAVTPVENTVIGCVATDATLSRAEAAILARAGSTALAQCISPAHLPFDGDVLFGLGHRDGDRRVPLAQIIAAATEAMVRAILNGVRYARTSGGVPAARSGR